MKFKTIVFVRYVGQCPIAMQVLVPFVPLSNKQCKLYNWNQTLALKQLRVSDRKLVHLRILNI